MPSTKPILSRGVSCMSFTTIFLYSSPLYVESFPLFLLFIFYINYYYFWLLSSKFFIVGNRHPNYLLAYILLDELGNKNKNKRINPKQHQNLKNEGYTKNGHEKRCTNNPVLVLFCHSLH